MANNTWNSWVSYVQKKGTWNMYDGYKPQKITNPVNFRHKSVIRRPNRVLHFEIIHSTVKITTHVLYSVLSIHGEILRIVVYKKFRQRWAFVEFSKEEFATKVIDESNYIKLSYMTLRAEYANPSSINVVKNDDLTWDYSKSPLLDYVNGLPTLKSTINVAIKDSPQKLKDKNIAEHDRTWELVENFDFIKPVDKCLSPEKTRTTQVVMTANSKTRKTLLALPCSKLYSILSVRGLDPTKSNCNRLFRLLSMYAMVANINYSRELSSAEVQISKCDDINAFAQIQHHYLSHGSNLSFQYLKDKKIKNRSINPFVLPDGSPSYIVYDRKMIQHESSPPPSRVLRFDGAPNIHKEKLISILKRKILTTNLNFKIITPKNTKKSLTVSGEIWFSTVSEAIEVVMELNYAIFWNKDTNKKDYVMTLAFISEELLMPKMVAIKTRNNEVTKTEDKNTNKTEGNKVTKTGDKNTNKTESNKVTKTEDKNTNKTEGNKVTKTGDKNTNKTESNKVTKTEDKNTNKTEGNKVTKTEDKNTIKTEGIKVTITEGYRVIKTENNKRIKVEDYKVTKTEDDKAIKTKNDEAIKIKDDEAIKTEDDKAIKTEVN